MKMIRIAVNGCKSALSLVAGFKTLVVALVVTGLASLVASAQTNFPDATVIYTGLYSPFNTSLSWVIGATAVLVLIGWILKAVRRK